MESAMKRFLFIPCVLLFTLFWAGAALADWTAINDEIDIDYQTHEIRIFSTGKDWGVMATSVKKELFAYIGTLTIGEDKKKLADVFKARKTMASKVQTSLQQKLKRNQETNLDDGSLTAYYYYSLKHLLAFFPDFNLPTPGDQ